MSEPTTSSANVVTPVVASETERSHWFLHDVHVHDLQLRAYLRGAFPAVRDVDDVVQESYLRIWKAKAAHPIVSARGFLFTVARRLALKQVTRAKAVPMELVGDWSKIPILEEELDPADALSYREKVGLLAEALARLPERCRKVVILRKLRCLPQRVVAEQLGLSERTVENQLARGVKRCEIFFREHGVKALR